MGRVYLPQRTSKNILPRKEITENGVYNSSDDGYSGYHLLDINISPINPVMILEIANPVKIDDMEYGTPVALTIP